MNVPCACWRGASDSIIEAVLDDNHDSEVERAREVWRRKFGTPPSNSHEKAKQMLFLQGLGFSQNVIHRTLTDSGTGN